MTVVAAVAAVVGCGGGGTPRDAGPEPVCFVDTSVYTPRAPWRPAGRATLAVVVAPVEPTQVFVDDQLVGATPDGSSQLLAICRPGIHELRVERPGWATATRTLELRPDRRDVFLFALDTEPPSVVGDAQLTVTSDAAGDLVIDGASMGSVDASGRTLTLPARTHAIEVRGVVGAVAGSSIVDLAVGDASLHVMTGAELSGAWTCMVSTGSMDWSIDVHADVYPAGGGRVVVEDLDSCGQIGMDGNEFVGIGGCAVDRISGGASADGRTINYTTTVTAESYTETYSCTRTP